METMVKESEKLRQGWQRTTLGEACELIMGQSPPSTAYNGIGEGLPFFQGKTEFGDLHPVAVKWCTEPNKIAEPGDILLSVRAPVGPTNLADQQCCIGRGLSAVRPQNGTLSKYVLYYLRSIESRIDALGTGTTFKAVSGKVLRDLPLPLAPLPEQRRIVSAIETQLGRLDAAVARLHAAKAKLKRYKQAVLKAAFSEGDWPIYTTSDVTELITDGDHQAPPQVPNGVPFIVISNVKNNAIDFSITKYVPESYYAEITEKRKPRRGDVLYTVTGSYGIPVLVDHDEPFCFQRHIALLRPNALILPAYLFYWLQTPEAMAQAKQYATGTAQMTVSLKGLRSFELPVPPIKDQKRIVREVEERLGSIAGMESTLDAQLVQSTRLRQAVLKRAFEGRLVAAETPVIQMPAPLSIAAEPTADYAKKSAAATNRDRHFARMLLSAEVVHQMHAEPEFNDVKHQKVFQLCEYIAQIPEIQGEYKRWRAGAFDNRLFHTNLGELKKQKWYDKSGARYVPMAKAGTHEKYLGRWSDKIPIIQPLLDLLKGKTADQCEIFATAYFAWNDLILWGREATEDTVFDQVWNHWHESKRRFSEERWRTAIRWIKGRGYAPTGFGKATREPT